MKTQSDNAARSVPLHRFVRLVEPIAGRYCNLKAGEIVTIQPMTGTAMDNDTVWRVERKEWINSLTISNVLCMVPDHALIVEEPNDQSLARRASGSK